jgi:hypothetical protein
MQMAIHRCRSESANFNAKTAKGAKTQRTHFETFFVPLRLCDFASKQWAVICLLALVAACSSRTSATVHGKVTLDGAPLDDATVSFVPTAGGARQSAWTTIKNGEYAIAEKDGLGTGPFRVEIRALRPTGEKPNPNEPTMVPSREIIPSRYNSGSELKAEIKPGKNAADFVLKSK